MRVAFDNDPVDLSDYDNLTGNIRRYGADLPVLLEPFRPDAGGVV